MNGLREIETKNSLWEKALALVGISRAWERASARVAERKDYKISPESQAALDRGDRQRATGVYEGDSYLEGVKDEDALTQSDAEDEDEGCAFCCGRWGSHQRGCSVLAAEQEGRNHSSNVNED